MWIYTRPLIFGKKCRVNHFPYIVIQCSGTHKRCISANLRGCRGSQIGNLHGMLKGTRRFFRELFQQRFVDISQFHHAHTRNKTKRLLENINQQIRKHDENEVDKEINQYHAIHLLNIAFGIQRQSKIHKNIGYENKKRTLNQLRTFGQFFQHKNGNHSHSYLNHDKLERIRNHQRTEKNGHNADKQCRPRIDKSTDQNSDNGIWNDIDIKQVVFNGYGG